MKDKPIDLTGSKILIVDDQLTTVDILRKRLESEGYRISLAQSGERALQLGNRTQPDLILLDIRMPGIDGLETCRRLKRNESTQEIPVVFNAWCEFFESLLIDVSLTIRNRIYVLSVDWDLQSQSTSTDSHQQEMEANQKILSSTGTSLSPPKTPASLPFVPGVARFQKFT